MRVSEAGLALIERRCPGAPTQYLVQWNPAWQMFSLVGGHREEPESFRDCCEREVSEELLLIPGRDFVVAERPLGGQVEYIGFSKAKQVNTRYVVELFSTNIVNETAKAAIDADPQNYWVTESEIRGQMTADQRPITAQVPTVFELCGVI